MNITRFKSGPIAAVAALSILLSCSKNFTSPQQSSSSNLTTTAVTPAVAATSSYQLIWSDEFNTDGGFDTSKWSFCERGTPAWTKYLTENPAYAYVGSGNLKLRMDNSVITGDSIAYHSGGVKTSGKFNFLYGKVEVRAKFNQGQGSWPAIWMMPDNPVAYGGWPNSGEIDIMEHVNFGSVVYQTVHNATVTSSSGGSSASHAASYNASDYNIYTLVWSPASLQFYVNNVLQYTYSKPAGATYLNWPYDQPFYIILNQSGGAGWPGAITDSNLPFTMDVDYVRVYKNSLLTNGGFETGALSPWTTWGTVSQLVSTDARTGSYAIREQGTGETSIEQSITGLEANTTYRFGGFGKVDTAGQSVLLGVKNYGGSAVDANITSTTYQHNAVLFTTGASNTSATLYYYKPLSGTVFGDDFYLEKMQ